MERIAREKRRKETRVAIWILWSSWAWIFNPHSVCADTNSSDVSVLNVLFTSLNSPSQLAGWRANGGDPCGQSWQGITCSGSSVISIKLTGLGLSGTLSYNMINLDKLTELDLSNNNIGGGSTIQYNLPPNLQTLNLAGNQFGENIPYSVSLMTSLKYLNLAHNQLQGNLSDMFSKLANLATLDLSFNSFTGDLPKSFRTLTNLSSLYLQNNQFTGPINALANLPLQNLNVANNRFTGWIPDQLRKINNLQIDGNAWSSSPAPPPPPFTSPPAPNRRINPGNGSGVSTKPSSTDGNGGGSSSGISGGVLAGVIIAVLVLGGIVAFFLVKLKLKKSSASGNIDQNHHLSSLQHNEVKDMEPIPKSSMGVANLPPLVSINLKPPPNAELPLSLDDVNSSNKPALMKSNAGHINATVYSVADLQIATNSFNTDNLVEEGSFGRVYKAHFPDEKVLAVKKIHNTALPNQTSEGFTEMVSIISRLRHQNLSELVGYCMEHGQHLLVYAFYQNGSLHDLLHLSDEYSRPLSWNIRVMIALGSARALEYLHEVCSPPVIHKNFKSSNILLDAELNPHISDAGILELVPDADLQAMDQNSGYRAPEVTFSGQYTLKSDVYSFGVIMLELMTGRLPLDSSQSQQEQSLVRWAAPQLHDIDALDQMVDPNLKGLYPAKSLSRFADIVALCVQPEPEFRPPMSEVVQALVRLVQRANMTKRMLDGDGEETPRRSDAPGTNDYVF